METGFAASLDAQRANLEFRSFLWLKANVALVLLRENERLIDLLRVDRVLYLKLKLLASEKGCGGGFDHLKGGSFEVIFQHSDLDGIVGIVLCCSFFV